VKAEVVHIPLSESPGIRRGDRRVLQTFVHK
jgi:hypothetical protein